MKMVNRHNFISTIKWEFINIRAQSQGLSESYILESLQVNITSYNA